MNYKINITTKNIADFNTEDTLYISIPGAPGYGRDTKLCQFIGVVGNRVHGKVIDDCQDNGTKWKGQKLGEEISATFEHCQVYGKEPGGSMEHFHTLSPVGFFAKENNKKSASELMKIPSEHESYGMIGFNRRTSSHPRALFGSSLQHKNFITLTIMDADIKRQLSEDRIHASNRLLEVEMSQEQFSQLITSFGMGNGIPCTFKYKEGKNVEAVPYQSKMDQFQIEFEQKMKNLKADIQGLIEDSLHLLENKKSLNKTDRKYISDSIKSLTQELGSNVPFVAKQFGEQMEKTVSEAKGEIESFFQQKITSLGIDAYKEQLHKMVAAGEEMNKIENNDK